MRIINNKMLLLKLRNPAQITQVIPKSKQLSDNEVAVHWGLEETQVLKNMRVNAPSPILGRYKWPGCYTPFEHQKDTAAFFTLNRRAFCLSEAGTGKTGSVLWAIDYLMNIGTIRRALIVCPLSIMDCAWRGDAFQTVMHRKVDIAYGTRDKRVKVINSDAEIVITNYNGIEIAYDAIDTGGFDLIVIDEATHYKSVQTTRWKTMNSLVKSHPDMWLWLLTGTPAAQSPVDAYGLARLVCPERVPKFFSAFQDMVMYKATQFKWLPKPDAHTIVHTVLQPAIRYTKEECLDLPELLYTSRQVELTPQQKKYYEMLRRQLVINAAGEQITAVNAAVGLNKMLQISSGMIYSDTGEVLEFDIKNRYNVLLEAIEQTDKKVLIFAPFKHIIGLLVDKLRGDGYTVECIQGSVSAGARADIFHKFQTEPDPRILVIQPQSAAHGVTLTAADTIVWWGPTPSLEIYAQANARAHRAGQRHPVTVIRLEGSPAEKHVYKMLDGRVDDHTKLVTLYKNLLA